MLHSVKDVRLQDYGEVSVRCESREHALKLAGAASEILKAKYDVEIQKPLSPTIRIIGFCKDMNVDELIPKLKIKIKIME